MFVIRLGTRLLRSNHLLPRLLWAALAVLGATALGVQSAYSAAQRVNVKSYGAVGDGHSDDTEAIARAIKTGHGRAVYLPAGTYSITRPLAVPFGPIRIFGDGKSSIVREKTNNMGVFEVSAASSAIEIDHLHLVETGTVHGQQLGRGAIFINPGGGVAVSNVEIHDNVIDCASTSCIAANNLVNSRIRSNVLDNKGTGEHGIYLSSNGDLYSEGVTIDSNVFHSDYRGKQAQGSIEMAIQIRGAKHTLIVNNQISGWSNGILTIPEEGKVGRVPGVRRLIIQNNTITSPGEDCFVNFFGTLSQALVGGNKFESCGRNGIRSDSPLENCIFESNRIDDSGEAAIRLNSATHSVFAGNIIVDSGSHAPHNDADRSAGIRLANGNRDNLFARNTNNFSQGSAPHFGLSIGGASADVINPGNCFESNTFSPDRRGTIDAAKFTSGCSGMNKPIRVQAHRSSPSAGDSRLDLAITNPNRIPVRLVQVEPRGAVSANGRDCWELLPAGGSCMIGLASSPVVGAASPGDQLTITYDDGLGKHTLKIPVTAQ